tara:strand:+ start:136 stop:438 length:303 start_codon:yes stop_codon:yes gene_type:complete
MPKNKRDNTKKKDISNEIYNKLGYPKLYLEKFLDDTIEVIIEGLIKDGNLKIDNFGSFKILKKGRRIGRNPRTKKEYEISPRKIVTFKTSNFLKEKINNG